MKTFEAIKKSTYIWIILVVFLTVPAIVSLLQPGYFPMHDDLQVMRIFEMDKCVRDGQLPCRWIPDMGFGYGYPLFNFYPVMPYYLGELIHLLGFSLIWSVKIDFILGFLVSAVGMFYLGRKLWGNLGGFISSMFFVYAPYHAVDIYVRGEMAEGWSLAWTPAVFLYIYEAVEKPSLKNISLLAVFSALFLLSHNPMALIFTPIMGIWALILIWQNKKWKNIPNLAAGAFWGLGLAAFFTIPILFEQNQVHTETLFEGYFNYLAHFVDVKQLFLSRFWGYGPSVYGPNDGLSFQIGWLHWIGLVVSLLMAVWFWEKDRLKSAVLVFLFVVFWVGSFLMHPRANPLWERLFLLQDLQFPWRILAITVFTSSLAVGSFFSVKFPKKILGTLVLVVLLGVFVLYLPYFHIEKSFPKLTDQEKLSGALWDLQRTAGIFDYLPKTAKFPPAGAAPEHIEVLSGQAVQAPVTRGSDWISATLLASSSASIRLPIIDFPTWKVFVDGKQVNFSNKNDLGQPTFTVTPGQHQIFAQLYNTPVRIIANIVSLVSFLLLIIAYLFIAARYRKKHRSATND